MGVDFSVLELEGVVSEVIVCVMVVGVFIILGVDVVIVVLGIVGFGGGMLEKFVGIIWIVVGN